ncbi:ArsR family transcriptional regulator [Candidatus Thorarchaeota archaeon]|nr:MAG: ArsR family transcriptional regulator [Candidatus Thorarchaeota archaeon]
MNKDGLTGKQLSLLVALQEGPMDTIQELAEHVKFSRTTVSEYLRKMSSKGRDPSTRLFRVVPQLDEVALGLNTIDCFIMSRHLENLERMEALCDEHPYTKYRARCYGAHSGLFAQFRVPRGTNAMITDLLKRAKSAGFVEAFSILPTDKQPPLFSTSRVANWNPDTFTWRFDWDRWFDQEADTIIPQKRGGEQFLDLLTKKDLHIICQLNHGARRKQKDMIGKLGKAGIEFTSQDFSRRLKRIEDRFISGYHVFVEPTAFDLYTNVILTATCDSDVIYRLQSRMTAHPIPFRSTLKTNENYLFWYLQLPPSHLSALLGRMHAISHAFVVTMLDYHTSQVYGPWAEAFDENSGSWRQDRNFMVTDVLKRID